MDLLLFTATGIAIYFAADLVLKAVERGRGRPFADRGVAYFLIFLAMALSAFALIRLAMGD